MVFKGVAMQRFFSIFGIYKNFHYICFVKNDQIMIDYEEKIKDFEIVLEEMYDDFKNDGFVEEASGIGAALDKFRKIFNL